MRLVGLTPLFDTIYQKFSNLTSPSFATYFYVLSTVRQLDAYNHNNFQSEYQLWL
jgi:hypothetical protein